MKQTTQGRLLLALLLLSVSTAYAADPGAALAPLATQAELAIPVPQIAERAQQTDNELRDIRAGLAPDASVAAIAEKLPATAAQVEQLGHALNERGAPELTAQALQDLRRQWLQVKDQLAGWAQTLGTRTQVSEQNATRLGELDEAWARAAAAAQEGALPRTVRDAIRITRDAIHETQRHHRQQHDTLLASLGRISSLQSQAGEALEQLDLAEQLLRRDLLVIDAPPLWTVPREMAAAQPIGVALRAGLARNWALVRTYAKGQWPRLAAHGALLIVLLGAVIALSRRPSATATADAVSPAMRAVLSRPISAALILALMVSRVIHPYAPVVLDTAAGLLAVVPMMWMFRDQAIRRVRSVLPVVALLLLASGLRQHLPPFAPVARLLLFGESVAVIVWLLAGLHPRSAVYDLPLRWQWALRLAVRCAVVLLASAAGANLVGNVALAIVVTEGVAGSALAAVALLTADVVIEALFIEIIRSDVAQRSRAIASRGRALLGSVIRVTRGLMVLAWFGVTLELFALRRPFLAGAHAVLDARLTMGTLSLSLGDVLTVLLTIWLSFVVARVVRVLLEEDALPRLSLPRGVPGALSSGVNYVILFIGVLFALSAAGVDPGRVALIAGALGVGIGFGLQNVVNNFVSGLILLFERPVQIGDIVTFGDTTGQVRRIGIRSSTITTFDGAEVIVPNGALIAEQVVNWTLSSDQRRLEVKVGVAYGTNPSRVLDVLEWAAKQVPEVLETPSPRAIFVGFGDSSLDFVLWAWTDRQDMLAVVRSNVGVAAYDALSAAGITIPFPQRDVRVTSTVAPPADRRDA